MHRTLTINPEEELERRLARLPRAEPKKPNSKHDVAIARRPWNSVLRLAVLFGVEDDFIASFSSANVKVSKSRSLTAVDIVEDMFRE